MINLVDIKKITALHADEIKAALCGVADSGWFLKGPFTERFEHAYADYIGTTHCVACGNGLDALTLILRSYMEMGIMQKGDEVILPANAYIACMISVSRCGLRPVPVEPCIDTLQIDDALIENAITPRTKGIMIVHMYGRCAYTERIADICHRHSLRLIEDNAQAHGCLFDGKHTGSLGDAAAHSFYPTKNLGAIGDAGAVTTNDSELADMVRALGNYGSERKYVFSHIGINSRMDETQAAVLLAKLPYLDAENARRRDNAAFYMSNIHNEDVLVPNAEYMERNVFHIFPILSPHRDRLQQYLKDNGVQTDVHYPIPPHKQRCYAEWAGMMCLPITERIHREELSLPVSQVVSDEERAVVAHLINEFRP